MKNIASLKGIQKKVGIQATALKDTAAASTGKLGSLKEMGIEKIKELASELNAVLPLVEETGYRANELEFELGLTPAAIIHFEKFQWAGPGQIGRDL